MLNGSCADLNTTPLIFLSSPTEFLSSLNTYTEGHVTTQGHNGNQKNWTSKTAISLGAAGFGQIGQWEGGIKRGQHMFAMSR